MPRHIPPPRLYWLLLAALPLLLLLGGCESTVETRTEPASQIDPRLSRAEGLEAAGDNLAAAELFLQLAGESQGARQGRLRLRAAENYLRAGDPDRAEAEIRRIDATGQPQLAFARRLLEAELATTRHHPDQALALLQAPPPADSDRSTRIRYHRLRAEAFRLAGDLLGRGRELEALDSLLQDPDARLANQLAIIQTYTILSDQALQRLTPSPPGEHGGWMALARIIKNHGNDRARARPLIDAWRQRFPAHPALPALLDGAYQKLKGQYRRPSRIAILLPEEGRYARVARALRDGFLAAYYQEPVEQRPQLLFYDSSDPDRIWPLYQEAVAAGADLVVGPLDKQGVAQLARAGELETPVLALNQVAPEVPPPADLYQFSLSPEDEARQVAERAWLDGFTQGLVMIPQGRWGERLSRAFRERWEALGGTLLKQQAYDPAENDFSQPIQALLNLDRSTARHRQLQRLLGEKLEFEPRRRQDAQFLFLVAKSQKAREIRPQLQFHHAADLPLYATSAAYSGRVSPQADRDLEGLVFLDIPWLLVDGEDDPLSRQRLARVLPESESRYRRLYAMGIDSYRLLPHLARLQNDNAEMVAGESGNLYLDRINHIHRQLVWARMEEGIPRLLGYAPRMDVPDGPAPPAPETPAAGAPPPASGEGTAGADGVMDGGAAVAE